VPVWVVLSVALVAGLVIGALAEWCLRYVTSRDDDLAAALLRNIGHYKMTPLLYHGDDEPEHVCVWQPYDACLQRERCIYRAICEMQFKRFLESGE
jgi:hypothetical protein